jgi:hypothetical protein
VRRGPGKKTAGLGAICLTLIIVGLLDSAALTPMASVAAAGSGSGSDVMASATRGHRSAASTVTANAPCSVHVVRVPEQNVVYTGDLLVDAVYPACSDEKTTVSGWRATLKTFASWDKDTLFVPGHGQLCGQRGIAVLRAVFDDIAEQAGKLLRCERASIFLWDKGRGELVGRAFVGAQEQRGQLHGMQVRPALVSNLGCKRL